MALMMIWAIWRERNARVFREVDRPASVVLQDVIDERTAWGLAGCSHLRDRE